MLESDANTMYVDLAALSKRVSLSVRTIRARVHDPIDPLPAYRVGGKLLFKWLEVERWIQAGRVEPIQADGDLSTLLKSLTDERATKD